MHDCTWCCKESLVIELLSLTASFVFVLPVRSYEKTAAGSPMFLMALACAKLSLWRTQRVKARVQKFQNTSRQEFVSTGGFSLNICVFFLLYIYTVGFCCHCESVWNSLCLQVDIFIIKKNSVSVRFEFSVVFKITRGCMLLVICCFFVRQVTSAQLLICYFSIWHFRLEG